MGVLGRLLVLLVLVLERIRDGVVGVRDLVIFARLIVKVLEFVVQNLLALEMGLVLVKTLSLRVMIRAIWWKIDVVLEIWLVHVAVHFLDMKLIVN